MSLLRTQRAAVLHVNTASRESISPTMRIARFAADTMAVPLVHNVTTAEAVLKRYKVLDVLFVKFGMLKFSQHREQCLELYSRAKVIINLENDYTFVPDVRFRRINDNIATWGTVDRPSIGMSQYVNWNVLTWCAPGAWTRPQNFEFTEPTVRALLYYGAYRNGRVPYFKKYFVNPPYKLAISSFRGTPKFKNLTGEPDGVEFYGAFRDPAFIRHFQATIYIEDEASHDLYCSPGNRFYECLQLGIAQFFDQSCYPTFKAAGFDIKPFIVNDADELTRAMIGFDKVRRRQRAQWWRNYANELRGQLRSAARRVFGARCGV